jgi:hypothetical protein
MGYHSVGAETRGRSTLLQAKSSPICWNLRINTIPPRLPVRIVKNIYHHSFSDKKAAKHTTTLECIKIGICSKAVILKIEYLSPLPQVKNQKTVNHRFECCSISPFSGSYPWGEYLSTNSFAHPCITGFEYGVRTTGVPRQVSHRRIGGVSKSVLWVGPVLFYRYMYLRGLAGVWYLIISQTFLSENP